MFGGIGSWKKSLTNLNIPHEEVFAIEKVKKIMQSYNIIHNTNHIAEDVTEIKIKNLPYCDLFCYSPLCQTFSTAGNKEGFNDPRGMMFFKALEYIEIHKPKYAIMENVRGLTQNKFKNEFALMIKLLEEQGYKNHVKVLDAADYNTPQTRHRVFIVSIRNDIDQNFEFPNPVEPTIKLADLVEDKVDEKYYVDDELLDSLLREFKGIVSINGACACLTPMRAKKRQNGRRFKTNGEPAFTVNTLDRHGFLKVNFDGTGIKYMIRQFTPLESLRLMGFEDEDYHKLVEHGIKESLIYHMAGNSIPVRMVEAILRELLMSK